MLELLSHLSSFKKTVAILQAALRRFGISAFVAHVDIEPTKEWQEEIEAGLFSMDALAAILMPGFKESSWTDQEVGVAFGRGVLIIPIIRGLTPYGFIGKFQGLQANGKSVAQVASAVFQTLIDSPLTRAKMLTCLVETTLQSAQQDDAIEKLRTLEGVQNLPLAHLERLREGAVASAVFIRGPAREQLNDLLVRRGLQRIAGDDLDASARDETIPF